MVKRPEKGEMIREAVRDYKKVHNDSLLGKRVARGLMLENEGGQQCAVFQIRVRCAEAMRRDRIYH